MEAQEIKVGMILRRDDRDFRVTRSQIGEEMAFEIIPLDPMPPVRKDGTLARFYEVVFDG